MKYRLLLLIVFAVIAALAVLLGLDRGKITLVGPDGERIPLTVELAITPEERQLGLMERESLRGIDGMLFVASEREVMKFWMQNTLLPLDAIFFDEDGGFVSSVTMIPCVQDPCEIYESQSLSRYGLEVPAGFVAENAVRTGWRLEWNGMWLHGG